MSSWSPFGRMEEVSFKRVPEGWLFQAPSPWVIGPRQHYLVNEAQKAELAAALRRMWWLMLIAIIVAVTAILPVVTGRLEGHPVVTLVISALIGLVIGALVTWYALRPVHKLVAGLTPTDQRITRLDAMQRQMTVFSRGQIVFFGLLSLALLLLAVSNPLLSSAGWDTMSIFGTLLFGAMTIYWLALYIGKRRRERAAG